MKNGIAIVGLNGSGKSTLAHALAKELGFFEIDVEDYYFPAQKSSRQAALEEDFTESRKLSHLPFSSPRSKDEVGRAMLDDMNSHPDFILSGVDLSWDEEILARLKIVFWLKTPAEERMKRIEAREKSRWGLRVAPGGDMYENQSEFRESVRSRSESKVSGSLEKLACQVTDLDGTLSVAENVRIIKKFL